MTKIIGRSRGARILNLALLVLLIAAASVAFAAAGPDDSAESPPATTEVERGVVVSSVSADGNVEPPRDLSLGFESGGRVEEVYVSEGEPVRRGALLARVDDGSARAQLRSTERSLASARERLRDTRAGRTADELDRNQRSLDQSRVSVDRAEQDLANARSGAATNVRTLRRAVVRARVAGERAQLRSSNVRLARERVEVEENGVRYRRLEGLADRLRAQLDALRADQRDRSNAQSEAASRRGRIESDLSAERSGTASAEQARQAETAACTANPENEAACAAATEDRMRAEDDERESEQRIRELEDDLDDARADELEGTQNVTNLDFLIQSLQTRIAATERDEQTAKGDLDSSKATVRQYVSEVDQNSTALREAKRNLGSQRDSLANGVEQAQQQIDQARSSLAGGQAALRVSEASNRVDEQGADAAQIASDRASVASAAATVEDATEAVEDTGLRAPADGVASRVDIKEGEVVGSSSPSLGAGAGTSGAAGGTGGSGTSGAGGGADAAASASGAAAGAGGSGGVITLTQLSDLEVEAGFSETDASRISVGDPTTVTVDALPDEKLPARVVRIDPVETLVDNVVTYDVTFVLDAYPPELRPGMTATTDVIVDESGDALTVPKSAIRSPRGSSPTAVVLRPDGRQEARLVVTGLEGDSSTEVVGGLGEGERVVVPGGARQ